MGKNPSFQFYPSDWTRDLDDLDIQIEGAWIRIICRLWWSNQRGTATKTLREWANILRKTEGKTKEILQILIEKGVADGSVLDNQKVTITSRRMMRMDEISKLRYEVGLKGGNPALIKTVKILDNQTPNQNHRSSSSSSKEKKYKEKKILSDDEWIKTLEDNPVYRGIEVRLLYGKMIVWCENNGKKPTRKRFVNWLNREDRPLKVTEGEPKGTPAKLVTIPEGSIEDRQKRRDMLELQVGA